MATVQLPTRVSLPSYRYRIDLDGVTYVLDFIYNSRMEKWLVQVEDEEGNVLVAHVPIIVDWNLFGRFVQETMPSGIIAAYDSSGNQEDPGRFDLGARVKMVYQEASDG